MLQTKTQKRITRTQTKMGNVSFGNRHSN